MKISKPLPPYGKLLMLRLQAGHTPKKDVFVFIGFHAWQRALAFQDKQTILVLPFGSEPENYHWPVNGLSLLVFDTSDLQAEAFLQLNQNTIRKTAYVLLAAGARIVRVILSNHQLVVFRGETI